jgi:hypothetical protein
MHRQQGTPLGLLGTEAIAYVGPVIVTGTAKALRRLADALVEAADMATPTTRPRTPGTTASVWSDNGSATQL